MGIYGINDNTAVTAMKTEAAAAAAAAQPEMMMMMDQDAMTTEMPHDAMFSAGFADCAQEAIEYLLQVEKLDENDPVIVGLKQHLQETQQRLGLDENGVAMTSDADNAEDSNTWWLHHSSVDGLQQVPDLMVNSNDIVSSMTGWDSQLYLYGAPGCAETDTLPNLCQQSSQITGLTCELIELLSDCPDWDEVSEASDSDNDDEWLDVVGDMELTF